MRFRGRLRAAAFSRAFAVLVVFASAACFAPSPIAAGGPFHTAQRTLVERGAAPEYASFTVEERDSDYVRGFRERAAANDELRELVFHGVYKRDDPKAAGAQQVDELFIARALDPKPYSEHDVAAMVELAKLVKLRLKGVEDVRWFLHGENDALVEVRGTADGARVEFRQNKSGEAGVVPWRALVLDREGVPVRVDQ